MSARSKAKYMIRFIDLFAGIGGFRLALESLGAKCVFSSEIDKYCRLTYEANFNDVPSGYIQNYESWNIPYSEILCGGFPCQDFSIAGLRLGLAGPNGSLFDEIIRIADEKAIKVLFLENVKGLLNHDKGETFKSMLNDLKEINYHVTYKVIKASDFNLPQLRERVYIVAFKDEESFNKFQWPEPVPLTFTMSDVLKSKCEKEVGYTIRKGGQGSNINDRHNWQSYKVYSDVREGINTVHSWDIIETTDREKYICLTILRNRRKRKYGNKDGNALTMEQIADFIPDINMVDLVRLCDKMILKSFYDTCSFDFVNSRQLSGINGTYRLYSKDSPIYATLTASGGNDKVEVDGEIRTLTIDEMKMMMGFPESFKFPVSKTQAIKQLGNSVAIPVVKAIAEQILKVLK